MPAAQDDGSYSITCQQLLLILQGISLMQVHFRNGRSPTGLKISFNIDGLAIYLFSCMQAPSDIDFKALYEEEKALHPDTRALLRDGWPGWTRRMKPPVSFAIGLICWKRWFSAVSRNASSQLLPLVIRGPTGSGRRTGQPGICRRRRINSAGYLYPHN